jgi:hypothetical protein
LEDRGLLGILKKMVANADGTHHTAADNKVFIEISERREYNKRRKGEGKYRTLRWKGKSEAILQGAISVHFIDRMTVECRRCLFPPSGHRRLSIAALVCNVVGLYRM